MQPCLGMGTLLHYKARKRILKGINIMMDNFWTKTCCDRCQGSLESGRIMSMYNKDCICMACKNLERQRPDYKNALDADHEQIKQGNYNFPGIGGFEN